jgi:hypothetical protein
MATDCMTVSHAGPGEPSDVAFYEKEWEGSAVDLKDVLSTNATIMDVEACFVRQFCQATMTRVGFFMTDLLIGEQQPSVQTGYCPYR